MNHWMLPCVHLHIDGEEAWLLACRKKQTCTMRKTMFHFLLGFPMCSHYVPIKFPSHSQYLPQIPNVFLNMFSIAPHFYSICFGICCPPFRGQRGQTLYFKIEPSILRNLHSLFFVWTMGQSNWVTAKKKGGKK
jgi:hypothetical protein